MTESEILMIYTETTTNFRTVFAAWFTITFGLYSLAYITGDSLKRGTVFFIVLTYILLTFLVLEYIGSDVRALALLIEDLVALHNNGQLVSNLSLSLIQSSSEGPSLSDSVPEASLLLLGFGAIGFLIYRHLEGRKTVGESDT